MSKSEQKSCPKCGIPLPADAPHGLCPRCLGGLSFETQTEPGSGSASSTPPISPADLAPLFPQLDGIEFVGRGGMGAVYKARQKQLERVVALKVLPPEVGNDPAFAERFAREAKALARLNHPGIITLYEFGQTTGPAPTGGTAALQTSGPPLYFFLMEFVDGVNLRELLRGGRVSPREALAIVPQICDALQYAHDQRIVHRDIKPENILVGRRGQVKVADFGIAKLVGLEREIPEGSGAAAAAPSLTEAGKSVGTPSYMAPEQREHPQDVDHRADIFALGVVFYEMLTGELPGERLTPPSKKVRIDVRLDEIVLQAMEKSPERRYQHVSEVKTAVRTVVDTPPSVPGPAVLHASTSAQSARSQGRGWNFAGYAVGALATFILLVSLLSVAAIVLSIFLPAFSRAKAKRASAKVVAEAPLEKATDDVLLDGNEASPGRSEMAQAQNAAGKWKQKATAPIPGRSSSCAVWTGREMIVFGGEGMNVSFGDGARYRPASNSWEPLPQQGASPSARTTFSAIWTGEDIIVWGGFGGSYGRNVVHNDGGKFVPNLNAWVPMSTVNAPEPRFNHVAVWTGKEMVVWGGYTDSRSWYAGAHAPGHLNTGGRYDPARNTWRSTTQSGAPSARINHVGVWTGSELIVWGGVNASEALDDGGLYNPVEDSWRPISLKGTPEPRCMPVAVWMGKEMIVWGGATRDGTRYFNNGGRYDPGTDTWRPLSTDGAPKGRMFAQAVWTGRHMLVWGGVNDEGVSSVGDPARYQGTGGLYDPETDSWRPISFEGAPSPRLTTAVWTGRSLLIFGGYNNVHLNDLHELLIEE